MAAIATDQALAVPVEKVEEAYGKSELLERLDELLEKYLNTLDEYQKAQQALASDFTSGYMFLAQANFNTSNRTRYGQDYYDERMQAARKVIMTEDEDSPKFSISGTDIVLDQPDTGTQETPQPQETGSEGQSADPEPSPKSSKADDASTSSTKVPKDPLRWFGILVPPALRSTQSSFVSAVEGPIPRLVTLIKDLRRQEIDIGRLRKQIRKL